MSDLKPMQLGRVRPLLAAESGDGVYSGTDADWDTGGTAGEGSANDQWKQPVRAATTASITISTALNNGDTLDGVTLATGDRVLVKDQGTPSQNGIYIVGATPERAPDFDDDDEVLGAIVYVIAGTTNTATAWKVTNTSAVTVGSTSIVFAAFGAGGSASFATPAIVLGSSASAGAASTVIRSDSTIAAFDATSPTTQALGDSAVVGSAAFAARRDHKHAMPTAAVTTSGLTQATGKLLGRNTASTGAIEEITLGTNLSFSGTTLNAAGGGGGATAGALTVEESVLSGSTVSVTSGADATIVSVSLSAGTWLVSGFVTIQASSPGADYYAWLTDGTNDLGAAQATIASNLWSQTLPVITAKVVLAAPGTVTLKARSSGATGTAVINTPNGTKGKATKIVATRTDSVGSGGLVLLEQHTASASATLDFTASISSTYDDYLIEFIDIQPATNTNQFAIRMSTNGGSSYDSSAIYASSHVFTYPAAGSGSGGSATQTSGFITGGAADNTSRGIVGTMRFYAPATTQRKHLTWDVIRYVASGINVPVHDNGLTLYASSTAVDAFQFLFTSGNISSGTIRVYGIAK